MLDKMSGHVHVPLEWASMYG